MYTSFYVYVLLAHSHYQGRVNRQMKMLLVQDVQFILD
jgi:hypothetical protein